jgi:hypothetical protein
MLKDPRFGFWFAEPFSEGDLDAAAAWLFGQGLVAGIGAEQQEGPSQVYLTEDGVSCAERFECDTARYLEAKGHRSGPGPAVTIFGGNSGAFQVAGDGAQQVQYSGMSAEYLRGMITSLAELIRTVAPGVTEVGEEQQKALEAAQDGAVDSSRIERFVAWVRSLIGNGVTSALTSVVQSATDDLVREACRLATHP